ncbi:hypothetical protein KOW79_013690 [Hemibagrus wyckioides]|uniref:Uncharacterized protein n=1 Tax=Hemibagrus wyckioides TaxID=337641 RepID=A0A9D3NH78_9TELE|nr:hypothetical protein KOW79_013690 [Hemibagrus wyckioides]
MFHLQVRRVSARNLIGYRLHTEPRNKRLPAVSTHGSHLQHIHPGTLTELFNRHGNGKQQAPCQRELQLVLIWGPLIPV